MSTANEKDILFLSKKAVTYDISRNFDAAIYFYNEAVRLLKEIKGLSKIPNITQKIDEYYKRAEELEKSKIFIKEKANSNNKLDNNTLFLERINFMLLEALEQDNADNFKEALELYLEAADLCIKDKKQCNNELLKTKLTHLASKAVERAENIKEMIVEKTLKDIYPRNNENILPVCNDLDNLLIDDFDTEHKFPDIVNDINKNFKKRHSIYSKQEIGVLRHTSCINGILYPPFLDDFDSLTSEHPKVGAPLLRGERFSFGPAPFSDPQGPLALSPKQMIHFASWARPSQLAVGSTPTLFPPLKVIGGWAGPYYPAPDWAAVRQTLVSDCSFVASLTVCALHEARFFSTFGRTMLPNRGAKRRYRPLISNLIYPRDRAGLRSLYNPCGKYVVKLLLNGVHRKVVVDDTLPADKHLFPLCSYSVGSTKERIKAEINNREDGTFTGLSVNEFWVSILEKAYLKVMGGYDFPGSNSNIDLHCLTGWIPERVSIDKSQSQSHQRIMEDEKFWEMLLKKFHEGDLLVTLATGALTNTESERTGLIATHAYALVDVRKVEGYKLFRLKNPWSHVRWKGNFSESDRTHWEDPVLGPKLKKALSYDITIRGTTENELPYPDSKGGEDDGLFWIDWKSVRKFFDVFYLNWDPLLFPFTTCRHEMWSKSPNQGPITNIEPTSFKDTYILAGNPQYKLCIEQHTTEEGLTQINEGAIWVLLTRHITEKEDFACNKEFITVLVYNTNGEKIYYPYDPPPFIDGVRINSPHYLCKMVVTPPKSYTLVISEYEKCNTIYYTLRVYSTLPFTLTKIEDPYTHIKEFSNSWKGYTAGGCSNNPETYYLNPSYRLKITKKINISSNNHQLLVTLKAPKEYSIGIDLYSFDKESNKRINKISSGPFRSGFSILKVGGSELKNESQIFDIIPSTYLPAQEGPFILTIQATFDFEADLN
ncbi:unnamed protein product [Gordionus sp. m RMFG-2023]|uniref:calpain-7-like n=1 Tax=Gordionus sp. m RMFG-2023 TaxID=3053472 RepID=UPI0030E232D2